jgi:NAD(P)-dependent dehydrogenase (short-subunit alcohol dehydrogenase family)
LEQTSESFDRAFESNARAPYFLTAAVAPRMLARGRGSIVNISTMAARLAMPGLSISTASRSRWTGGARRPDGYSSGRGLM